jgi:hypothetical protein
MPVRERSSQHGQVLALFALALVALTLGVAVVIDGGYGFAQRRGTQNAADFAAMAGTRIVGVSLTRQPPGAGTAANVETAIRSVLSANGAELVSAQYVDHTGAALGNVVGAGSIPTGAFGVVVEARSSWRPFLLGVIGIIDWEASARATATTPGSSSGGGVLPVGIQDTTFESLDRCPLTDLGRCVERGLTSGGLNIPGGFGWLSFGIQGNGGKCDWGSSLGMLVDGGCQMSQPYLDSQIGPPANSHGCCTEVGLPGSEDKISTLTGNEWGDLSYYIENEIPVWVPIWDTAGGQGSNAYYDIVGFGAIIVADSGKGNGNHAKWLKGAAIEVTCPPGWEVPDQTYCKGPGGGFVIDVTGEVQLVR